MKILLYWMNYTRLIWCNYIICYTPIYIFYWTQTQIYLLDWYIWSNTNPNRQAVHLRALFTRLTQVLGFSVKVDTLPSNLTVRTQQDVLMFSHTCPTSGLLCVEWKNVTLYRWVIYWHVALVDVRLILVNFRLMAFLLWK